MMSIDIQNYPPEHRLNFGQFGAGILRAVSGVIPP